MPTLVGDGHSDQRFGRYLLMERVGIGGMATVHRAKTLGIDGFETVVAVKRILSHLAEDDDFVASFVREAKLASLLNHPNIARINELGRIDGAYFMAMEYIAGHTLLDVLRWERVIGPPPNDVIFSVLIQLCDALEYAHTLADNVGTPLGIVHRDLSPSNLILEHSGYLKVIDFGIAKAANGEHRTESGLAKGKQGYMSPEALRARGVDHRSDIYSTGVIAHELLTGRRLYKVKDDYETLARIMRGQVEAPSHWNPRCPAGLDEIVLRALVRDPDERWQSAGEMRDALESLALELELRPTHRAVCTWLAQARTAQSVLVRDAEIEEPEPPSIIVVTPTPTEETSQFACAAAGASPAPPAPATMSYVALETPSGRCVTMLEGPSRSGTDLRSLLHSRTPLPRTSWRRRDTLPPAVSARPARAITDQQLPSSPLPYVGLVAIGCALIALAYYLSW